MANTIQNEYHPDSVSAPGETLLETLDALGMFQTELAKRMGRPLKTINEIIQGKAAITPETALQLEQVLQVPASFWLKREQFYREFLARLAEEPRLNSWIEWLENFPLREMVRRGWIPSCEQGSRQVFEVLRFFGVASPDAWLAIWEYHLAKYYKPTAFPAHFGALTAWLRQGEIQAQETETQPYHAETFRAALQQIRALTAEPVSVGREALPRLCSDAGVALVFVQELPGIDIRGATQWLTPTKALVQLGQHYQTDDQFWFAFFHAAAHILLHGKRQVFLDLEVGQESGDKAEKQANTFATNMLVALSQ